MTILDAERRIHGAIAPQNRFHSTTASPHYAPDLRLEPVHLEIAIEVDLERQRVKGTVTHTIRCNAAGARSLKLDAVNFDALDVDAPGVECAYDGRVAQLVWTEPFTHGEERTVAVRYEVVMPAAGIWFSKPTEAVPDAPLFAVTDHETERARHWLPTIDSPAARPTIDWSLRTDAKLTALANGRFVDEEVHGDGTKTSRWQLEQRCPSYLTCFAIGDFVRWDGGEVDGIPIAAFGPRSMLEEADLERSFRRTADMLRWLPKHLGTPFPYPKYFQFAAPGIGGAMENISLTSWDTRYIQQAELEPEERQLFDVINLHELAHTWFGDLVVCRDYAHAWLKEGWATYTETCWLAHDLGKDASDYDLYVNAHAYFGECRSRYQRPIVTRHFDSSWQMYDMHLYPGAAWRIHMLRKLLGDGVFWPAVQRYVSTFASRVVETDDFRRTLEEASGRSLARFFDQWLHHAGYPKLKVAFEYDAEERRGKFEIEQTQTHQGDGNPSSAGSSARIPNFDFDLELEWAVDGTRERQTVAIRGRRAQLEVPMSQMPSVVRVDPDLRVLHELDLTQPDSCWLNQLNEPDVVGRIQAGHALCKEGTHKGIAAVKSAFARETFWGVQVQLATALGFARTVEAKEALLAIAEGHEEPKSLAAVIRALGQYRDPRICTLLAQRLDRGLPPRAAEVAHEVLGRQREAAPIQRLVAASNRPSSTSFAQSGALRGLAASRSAEALEALLADPQKKPLEVRPAVAEALGEVAPTLDKRDAEKVEEKLLDLLSDPLFRVRQAAANALCAAGATQHLAALRAHQRTLAHQDAVTLGRSIDQMLRTKSSYKKLELRLIEVEDRLQKAQAQLGKLQPKTTD